MKLFWKNCLFCWLLLGRDPLRNIPEQSPLTKKKTKYISNGIAEDRHVLSEEARDHFCQKLNRLNERQPSKDIPVFPGKTKAASLDDGILDETAASQRPGLKGRAFSAGVGLADFAKQSEELQQSGSDESLSAHDENSANNSEYSTVEETRSGKTSPQILATHSHGTAGPSRKKHVVIQSFLAVGSGEVSLEEGEEVNVLQKESSGWWYVKNDFCKGWAPSAFLAPVGESRSPSPETPDQQEVSDNQEESCQIKENLDTCPKQEDDEERKMVPRRKEKVPIIIFK